MKKAIECVIYSLVVKEMESQYRLMLKVLVSVSGVPKGVVPNPSFNTRSFVLFQSLCGSRLTDFLFVDYGLGLLAAGRSFHAAGFGS